MKKILLIIAIYFSLCSWTVTWYGGKFNGNYTYSGEKFDMNKMTAASNHFAIGTKLKVTNKANGKSVIVRINDKGAMSKYTIDLSKGAFKKIAKLEEGRINVRVNIIK